MLTLVYRGQGSRSTDSPYRIVKSLITPGTKLKVLEMFLDDMVRRYTKKLISRSRKITLKKDAFKLTFPHFLLCTD